MAGAEEENKRTKMYIAIKFNFYNYNYLKMPHHADIIYYRYAKPISASDQTNLSTTARAISGTE